MWKMMHVKMFGWVLRKFTKHFRTEEHQNYTSSLAQFICEEGSSGPHWLSCFLCCMNLLQGHFAGFHRSLVFQSSGFLIQLSCFTLKGSPMISLMMQHLLPLATLLLLSIVPTETKVVASVAQCNESFLAQTPPNIPGILVGGNINDHNRYKVICQTLRDIRRFVTLYDTKNRIPVFSAAEYRGGPAGKRPKIKWMIEPQVSIQSRPGLIACCSEEVFTSLFHLCRQLSSRESSSSCFTCLSSCKPRLSWQLREPFLPLHCPFLDSPTESLLKLAWPCKPTMPLSDSPYSPGPLPASNCFSLFCRAPVVPIAASQDSLAYSCPQGRS
ncbi:uncharacterized protein LOC100703935 isoform X2 [Oreochromis niloticus]|uniref:uncharacterized protein LOC100703935 isoform X2 n=1 Tax=Oreochromis niloticus TaxID=8128 RepID=UPI000DF1D054|nr:uncharacterized protein LOC100703935 isoform X2 [Oreochromis niloticus]